MPETVIEIAPTNTYSVLFKKTRFNFLIVTAGRYLKMNYTNETILLFLKE